MALHNNKIAIGKRRLEEPCHKKVRRRFLDTERFSAVPMPMPARLQPFYIFRS